MAGMEGLGRLFNGFFIASAGTQAFKMRGASGATVFVNGATAQVTVNEGAAYAGPFTAVNAIKNIYWSTAANGTAAWNKLAYSSANNPLSTYTHGTTTGLTTAVMSAFCIFTSELSDPNDYVEIVLAGAGTAFVALHDLVVERNPANLEILGS